MLDHVLYVGSENGTMYKVEENGVMVSKLINDEAFRKSIYMKTYFSYSLMRKLEEMTKMNKSEDYFDIPKDIKKSVKWIRKLVGTKKAISIEADVEVEIIKYFNEVKSNANKVQDNESGEIVPTV